MRERSYAFALAVIRLSRALTREKEFVLSRQVLRAGTSIGANIEEAQAAQTHADFVAKMSIARKEARECHYWLRLIHDSNLAFGQPIAPLLEEAAELVRLLAAIVKSGQEHEPRRGR